MTYISVLFPVFVSLSTMSIHFLPFFSSSSLSLSWLLFSSPPGIPFPAFHSSVVLPRVLTRAVRHAPWTAKPQVLIKYPSTPTSSTSLKLDDDDVVPFVFPNGVPVTPLHEKNYTALGRLHQAVIAKDQATRPHGFTTGAQFLRRGKHCSTFILRSEVGKREDRGRYFIESTTGRAVPTTFSPSSSSTSSLGHSQGDNIYTRDASTTLGNVLYGMTIRITDVVSLGHTTATARAVALADVQYQHVR